MTRPLLLFSALILAACDAKTVRVDINPTAARYSRDTRTGICFAAFGRADWDSVTNKADSFSVTSVPCSPEVLALVPQGQR